MTKPSLRRGDGAHHQRQLASAEREVARALREWMESPCPSAGDKASHDWEAISFGWRCKRCGTTVEC